MTPLWRHLPIQEHGLSLPLLHLFKCLLLSFRRFSREQDVGHCQQSARSITTALFLLSPPSYSWPAFPQATGHCEPAEPGKLADSRGDGTAGQLHPSGRTRDGRLCHVGPGPTTHTRTGCKAHILSSGNASPPYPCRAVKQLHSLLEASLCELGHPGKLVQP